jgi:hypothetical protein
MSTFHPRPRPRRTRVEQAIALLVATCLILLAISAGAAARPLQPTAKISSAALRNAVTARMSAGHAFTRNSRRLSICLRLHPSRCRSQRLALARSRAALSATKRRVRDLAARVANRHHRSNLAKPTPAPASTDAQGRTPTVTTPPVRTASATPSHVTTPPAPAPSEASSDTGPFTMGLVAGAALGYELPFIEKLGAHTARMEFGIDTPAAQMAPTIEAYAKAGIQPLLLAGFSGRLPSPQETQNLASWAAEFGPKGTLWQGKSFPANTAVTHIEFGNETSYTYQFSNNSDSEYASRAQTYALRVEEAHEAIQASNSSVGLLVQADSGGLSGNEWVANMFKAVPNLGQLVAGWTVHPYGSGWQARIDQLVAGTAAVGASSSIPIYVTEWGLDTDNGRCLEYNYGWNKCMSYEEAASTLSSSISEMRSRYGSRLAAVYLYQAHDQQPTGTSTSLESYFGALQSNGAAKGAYTTEVESLLSNNA